jgi:hypothetical protein
MWIIWFFSESDGYSGVAETRGIGDIAGTEASVEVWEQPRQGMIYRALPVYGCRVQWVRQQGSHRDTA